MVLTEQGRSEPQPEPALDPVYDEMVTGDGHVRPHWQDLMARLAPLDPAAMEDRRDEAVQLLRQHGVTYAVYDDPAGAERPWPLDLLPFVIPPDEWRTIEAGVIQRARLLNDILADIYGPQRLIANGDLPPALLHANPNFLHPCRGAAPPGGIYLHFSAFDLCRAADGRWHILSDRTQAPSGAGYALENRGVVGRVLVDCIGVGAVQPLAPFFAAFRESLHALLPAGGRTARIVLLTPGPYNETYFEHVYLARHLGITLVEGSDLTVRDRRVFLKTLSGLEPVGVILRRLDDDFCDPIELRATSALGVAGLMEAVRSGNLAMANALGSGVTEAAAFKPFLAQLAPALIGETLILPDVSTWWCGATEDKAFVLDNLDKLLIKPAFRRPGLPTVFGGAMRGTDLDSLIDNILARPTGFVGQERVPLSTAPVWTGEKLEPRAMMLRVYVAAIGKDFLAMPGGLTRTAPNDGYVISMQMGSGSKDSWVLAPPMDNRAPANSARPTPVTPVNFRRPTGGELPSRVADGLFWVGRYAERADGIVRLLRTLLAGVTDAVQPWRFRDAEPILNLAAWLELTPVIDHPTAFQPITLVQSALLDGGHSRGVVANFQRLINAGRRVRDWLPPDCWRIFTAIGRHIQEPVGRAPPVRLLLRLEELITLDTALFGAVNESMTRDAGWRFVEIGRRLEHSIALVGTMRGLAHPPGVAEGQPIEERRLLAALLALTDPRGGMGVTPSEQLERGLDRTALLKAVLTNDADPRSLVFQLAALAEHLAALPRPADSLPGNPGLVDAAIQLSHSARQAVPDAIVNACQPHAGFGGGYRDPLSPAFARLDILIPQISDLLTQAYFTHVAVRSA